MKSCLDHFSFLLPSRFLCQFAVLFSISSLACSLLSCCCILTKKSFSSKGGMHEGRRPLKQSLFGMKKQLVIVILLGTRHFFKFWVALENFQVRRNLIIWKVFINTIKVFCGNFFASCSSCFRKKSTRLYGSKSFQMYQLKKTHIQPNEKSKIWLWWTEEGGCSRSFNDVHFKAVCKGNFLSEK